MQVIRTEADMFPIKMGLYRRKLYHKSETNCSVLFAKIPYHHHHKDELL